MWRNRGIGLVAVMAMPAWAQVANFDGFAEGSLGTSFTDGGIHFFDPDAYGLNGVFVAEWASDTLGGPNFSPPNALTMTGYSPGPQAAFSRVGSYKMSNGQVNNEGIVHFFLIDNSTNTVTLEAFLAGRSVALDSHALGSTQQMVEFTLSIQGTDFDELRVYGSGSFENGAFFGMADNVVMRQAVNCTGKESLKASCSGNPGKGKVKAVLKKGVPNAAVTFRLDGDPKSDTSRTTNAKGKAKGYFKKVSAGSHTVELLGCGVTAQTSCP